MRTKIYLALVAVLLFGVIAWAKGGSPVQAKRKWEHKIISVQSAYEGTQALTKLQEDGWELVTVAPSENGAGGGHYYLKREK